MYSVVVKKFGSTMYFGAYGSWAATRGPTCAEEKKSVVQKMTKNRACKEEKIIRRANILVQDGTFDRLTKSR